MIIMKKRLFLFVCLFVAIQETVSVCSEEDEFTCANGQCIDRSEICDGSADCEDKSDETANLCQQIQCHQYEFQCAYGACIAKNNVCNNVTDCLDNSDENQLRCLKTDDEVDKYYRRLQGRCEPYFMQCNGMHSDPPKCIGLEDICDGIYDCPDKSDETTELCSGLECPSYAFKCSYGGCISKNLVCNHIADCVDGSDENPNNCLEKEKNWKEWKIKQECYSGDECFINSQNTVVPGKYNDNEPANTVPKTDGKAETEANEWTVVQHGESAIESKYCTLPQSPSQLQAFNYITGGQYAKKDKIPSKSLLRFRCPHKHLLIGREYNACFNGAWQTELPQCEQLCSAREASRGISTSHTCIYLNKHVDCNQPARVGTVVQYTCAPQYQSDGYACLKNITCMSGGKWSSNAPTCSPTCVDANDASPDHQPWLVTIYERSYRDEFILKCYGAVVSPKLVISVDSCFGERVDRLMYQIAEGKQHADFNEFDGHSLRLHNISHLQLEVLEDSIDWTYKIALLTVVDYFQFSRSLSPLCIPWSKSDALIKQLDAGNSTKIGELHKPINGELRIVYKYYPNTAKIDGLDIGQFMKTINSQKRRHMYIL